MLLPKYLLDSDDDWQETLRRQLYPLLHPYLKAHGGYALGHVSYEQFVGSTRLDEELLELELEELGFRRNPFAALKSLPDDRVSEGSWVLLAEDSELVDEGMQLHVTLFERTEGEDGREVYAHYEDDWRVSPRRHVRGDNLSAKKGVQKMTKLLDEETYMVLE